MEFLHPSRRTILLAGTTILAMTMLPQMVWAQAAKPKIGFIGAGRIGSALAKLWVAAGYQVMLSARDLGPVRDVAAQIGPNAQVGTPAEAAAWGDVVVVTVPYGALPQVGRDYAAQLKGKIVLDTCNPNPKADGELATNALEKGTGAMDRIYLAGARPVRAFNGVGANQILPSAHRQGELVGVPIAADDKEALTVAAQLVRDAGFDPVIVGGLSTAKSFDDFRAVHGTAAEIRAELGLK